MSAIDRKLEEICSRIYKQGYHLRISRETAKNLEKIWLDDQKNPARPTMTLPSRIRVLAAPRTKFQSRW